MLNIGDYLKLPLGHLNKFIVNKIKYLVDENKCWRFLIK